MPYTIEYKPSMVYTDAAVEDLIRRGYKIIDFRPLKRGDYWIAAPGGRVVEGPAIDAMTEPRFIVEPPPAAGQFIADFWE